MIRKALLGGTALVAIALSTSAQAGTVGTGDNLALTLFGEYRFHMTQKDQDITVGTGRGYSFASGESELGIEARATAANGLLYGVEIVLNAGTDDTAAADKTYAFIDGEEVLGFGRFELGDTDDVIDNMLVAGEDVMVGRAGFDGEVGDEIYFGATSSWIGAQNNNTGKATKINYFSPRFAGLQIGASLTPDSGSSGFSRDADNDGDFENVIGVAVNYERAIGAATILLSVGGEFGKGEPDTSGGSNGNSSVGDAETLAVGGTVTFGNFAFGAGFADLGEAGITQANQALGQDAGQWWDVAASYRTGPWGVSVGYYSATLGNVSGLADTEMDVLSFDAEYAVAPGWTLAASLNFVDGTNVGRTTTDNSGHLFNIYNTFAF